MNWQQNPIVKWGAHLVGLVAAVIGYAQQEPVAIAMFGAYLVFEILLLDDKVSGAGEQESGGHEQAVIGFARLRGERMQSGFATTSSLLASDLGKNWERLWDDARKTTARGHGVANSAIA